MNGVLAALASLAAPMTARVLMALGFSVVTVSGVSFGFGLVLDELLANVGGMPAAIASLFGIGGGWVALGAILGACSFVVSLWSLTAATRIMGTA